MVLWQINGQYSGCPTFSLHQTDSRVHRSLMWTFTHTQIVWANIEFSGLSSKVQTCTFQPSNPASRNIEQKLPLSSSPTTLREHRITAQKQFFIFLFNH